MKMPYSFHILRYVHDAVTQEFLNLGVVLFSPAGRRMEFRIAQGYGRISKAFERIDGARHRQLMQYLDSELGRLQRRLSDSLDFGDKCELGALLAQVLPPDDSALQFSPGGAGIASQLGVEADVIFDRYVLRYANQDQKARKTDDDVWRGFRGPLEQANLLGRLRPHLIAGEDYAYEFQHAWKNGVWNVYEPVSLDLADAQAITEKAARWLGRASALSGAAEGLKIHFLVDGPEDPGLVEAAVKAERILRKAPGSVGVVHPGQAGELVEELRQAVGEN